MATEPGLKSRLRDELIRRAKLGEITPEDAESEAALDDCGPLELRPESLDLGPGTENQWTLLMALVWIVERDPAAVCAVWIKARRAATHWVGSPLAESDGTGTAKKKSWELKPLDPPTVGDVDAVAEEAAAFMLPPFIVPGLAAREQLWASLQSGRLRGPIAAEPRRRSWRNWSRQWGPMISRQRRNSQRIAQGDEVRLGFVEASLAKSSPSSMHVSI